jgi:hypothetical protein
MRLPFHIFKGSGAAMNNVIKIVIALILLSSVASFAGEGRKIRVFGDGADQDIELEGESARIIAEYPLFKKNCTSCHSVRRVTRALNDWRDSSASRENFAASLTDMLAKKSKLVEGEMSADDAQSIHHFLLSLYYGEVSIEPTIPTTIAPVQAAQPAQKAQSTQPDQPVQPAQ